MRKYRVNRRYKKNIMNSNRLIELRPKEVVYLNYDSNVKSLVSMGYLTEITEVKSRKPEPKKIEKKPEFKKVNKSKAKEVVLEESKQE